MNFVATSMDWLVLLRGENAMERGVRQHGRLFG